MRTPTDCTYPSEHLCLHECCEGCVKKTTYAHGWRKRQIEDAKAEQEEFERIARENL